MRTFSLMLRHRSHKSRGARRIRKLPLYNRSKYWNKPWTGFDPFTHRRYPLLPAPGARSLFQINSNGSHEPLEKVVYCNEIKPEFGLPLKVTGVSLIDLFNQKEKKD